MNPDLYLMAFLYIAAGIYHFVNPRLYMKIMPRQVPSHRAMVYISGMCEILLGLLLFIERTRTIAAWGLIALLIAVFPANIQMMLDYYRKKKRYRLLTVLRLPVQLLLIWWAYQYTR